MSLRGLRLGFRGNNGGRMITFLHLECQLNLMQRLPPESNRSSESASLQEEKLAAVSTDTFGVLTMMEVHSIQDSSWL